MSKNLFPWLDNYLLKVARQYGAGLSSADALNKGKMLQIIAVRAPIFSVNFLLISYSTSTTQTQSLMTAYGQFARTKT